MTDSGFQFSAPAQLYAKHADIPDLVEEMRQECYRNISEFRDALLDRLADEAKPARLGRRTTNTTGRYLGADVQYMWFSDDPDTDWKTKVPMAYFFCPLPDKVKDEKVWREHLALISDSVLRIYVTTWHKAGRVPKQIRPWAEAANCHIAGEKKDSLTVHVPFDSKDVITSAGSKVAGLLRAIRDAHLEERRA